MNVISLSEAREARTATETPLPRRSALEILNSIDAVLETLVGPAAMTRMHQTSVNGRAAVNRQTPLLVQVRLAVKSDMAVEGGNGAGGSAHEKNLADFTAMDLLRETENDFGQMLRDILEVVVVSPDRLAGEIARIPQGALARVSYMGDAVRRLPNTEGLELVEHALQRLANRAEQVLSPDRIVSVPASCPECKEHTVEGHAGGTRPALYLNTTRVEIGCRTAGCGLSVKGSDRVQAFLYIFAADERENLMAAA